MDLTFGMDIIADDLTIYDSIIVGDGAAALNAALALGRSRDRVLLLDDDRTAETSHEADVRAVRLLESERRRALEQLRQYDVTVQTCHVTRIDRHQPNVLAAASKNRLWFGRRVLIADVRSHALVAHLGAGVRCWPARGGWECEVASSALETQRDTTSRFACNAPR